MLPCRFAREIICEVVKISRVSLQFRNPFRSKPDPAPEVEVKSSTTTTLCAPEPWAYELFGSGPVTSAGASVSPQSAMRCTAVRAAVLAISQAIGTLPVTVYRENDDGTKERAADHPIQPLLRDAANDWLPASDFREQMTRDALLYGSAYAQIIRVNGKPYALDRLTPGAGVSVTVDDLTGEPRYAINGQSVDRRDILHIRAPSILHTHIPESPVTQCREAIGVALAMEKHAGELFGNGARPSGILKFAGKLGKDVAERIAASWSTLFANGGNRRGGTAVLEEGGDFIPLTFSSVDAQFLELRRFAIEEIARTFGVPSHMLYELGRATWSNVESLGIEFVQYTLAPWITRWQSEIELKLFDRDERANHYIRFDTSELQKADTTALTQAQIQRIAARMTCPNEERALLNLPPYPDGDKFENPNTLSPTDNPKIPGVKVDANAA